MHLQLWSSNFAPEPTGIGPLSAVWASGLADRGHEVTVLAAHPHYPTPSWPRRRRPTQQTHRGVRVLRVPLRVGRETTTDRVLQDATLSMACSMAAPLLPRADLVVAATPSFPALGVAALHARVRRTPLIAWVHDVLPDGAVATGLLADGRTADVLRRYEQACYRAASLIVVISGAARENLIAKGVPPDRVRVVEQPATHPVVDHARTDRDASRPVVFTMGNVGLTQNLESVVRAFEADEHLGRMGAELVIAGDGIAAHGVREAVTTSRVRVTGVLGPEALEREARRATVGLVSQWSPSVEFNFPSKLSNLMARGLPIVAVARPDSEVARVVGAAGAGVVVRADRVGHDLGPALVSELLDHVGRARHSEAARRYAAQHFALEPVLDRWQSIFDVLSPVRSAPR